MMTIEESKAWRPEIEGWSDDILPFYDRYVKDCSAHARCVEVGSAHGRSGTFFAQRAREENKGGIELWCVDRWDPGWCSKPLRNFINNARDHELDLIRLVRASSEMASRMFEDGSLDFVFLDAGHEYDCIKDDLRLWFPKLKPGGLFAGHDYSKQFPGVVKAVDQFTKKQTKLLMWDGSDEGDQRFQMSWENTVWQMRKAI